MLKMYHGSTQGGGSPDYWDAAWGAESFDDALRFCAVDPLRPLFERYAPPGSWMLEGGCGMGQNVVYYAARGVKVVGLDFAPEALAQLRRRGEHLHLCRGDVAALPFHDESFNLYFSNGVVEHFEAGAHEALREARRVLRRNGVLLVSVPYLSPLRRLVAPSRTDWRTVKRSAVDEEGDGGRQFFQYAYTRREFGKMLEEAGLRVTGTQGYSILWGLHELPLVARLIGALRRPKARANVPAGGAQADAAKPEADAHAQANLEDKGRESVEGGVIIGNGQPASSSLLKRLVVSEDAGVPLAGRAVQALRWATAHMMMYVCVRDDYRQDAG
ncbi:MAG TPA: methyltransferase domain-containing protein [Pyrinomonadaceae bacterium]|nr:methyltransferase domain-containing protein [Pyrinomonadaceae bacterium]